MKKLSFGQVSLLWREEKKKYVKLSSYSSYVVLLDKHIIPWFGQMTAISNKDVQDFVLAKLEEGLSRKTVQDIVVIIKMIAAFGEERKLMKAPLFNVRYPTTSASKKIEVFTVEEECNMLNYVKEHVTPRNLGIYICLSTGLRIGEICALQWKDLDMERGVVDVSKTLERVYLVDAPKRCSRVLMDVPKTEKSNREIPMPDLMVKLLKPLAGKEEPENFVLTGARSPLEPRSYRCYFASFLRKLGIRQIKFHSLRHTFATRCIESGCDYKTVSVLLGHSNISTTLNLYVHPDYTQKKRCINTMFSALKKRDSAISSSRRAAPPRP